MSILLTVVNSVKAICIPKQMKLRKYLEYATISYKVSSTFDKGLAFNFGSLI